MANEARVRGNLTTGTLSVALTNVTGTVTMTSAGLANLPAVGATQHAVIVIENELVYVTAHTGGATTASILRAQEGTSAAAHSIPTAWVHGPVASDYVGLLGYAQAVTNQTGIAAGPTDLTSLTVPVTVAYAGHRIKITGHTQLVTVTAAAGYTVDIQEGATVLGRVAITNGLVTGERWLGDGSVLIVPTAGAHTYKLTATRFFGTGTLNVEAAATQPAWISVEDLGPAA